MNINNAKYAALGEKRERAIRYWQDQVIQHYLPSPSVKKKLELEELKNKRQPMGRNIISQMGKSYHSPSKYLAHSTTPVTNVSFNPNGKSTKVYSQNIK
jgi:malate/lactate dehydrogenase